MTANNSGLRIAKKPTKIKEVNEMKAKFKVEVGGVIPRIVLNRPHYGTSLNAKLRAYATYNGCTVSKALEAYKKAQHPIWAKRFAYR